MAVVDTSGPLAVALFADPDAMTPEQFASIKQYVGFDDASASLLRAFHPVAEPRFAPIVDDFYAAIEAHPDAHAAITGGQAQVDRLKQTLIRWLDSVLLGPHDRAYLDQHSRIGRVHVKIGLPQEFMFTAMNRIRNHLLLVADEKLEANAEQHRRVRDALNQMLDIELAVMLDTYREDLVARIRQQERLSAIGELEERYRKVIESVPAFVVALDATGNVSLWNRRLEVVTGRERSEMLGKPGSALVGAGEDVKLPLRAGGHRMVRWRRASVEMDETTTTLAVGVDVTEEREAQRRAMLAERLAAVGTLAAGLAHEVRNPLNSASLQLQVLERRIAKGEAKPDALQPVVTIVGDEIERLGRLVSEFLSFARPAPLDLTPVPLNELLASIVDLHKPECVAASIDLLLKPDPDVGTVLGDEKRLRQVFLNLLRNAIQAIDGAGTVIVRTQSPDAQGNVRVEVEDDGRGFPDGAPVFDAFYTSKEQGTGLGLAIVHSIVKEHGGSIEVESRPGRTCFKLALPPPAEGHEDA